MVEESCPMAKKMDRRYNEPGHVIYKITNFHSATMLGASFLPARLRHEHNHAAQSNPGYINRRITAVLQWVSRSAFTHPIHTIVSVALLASTCYVGFLEGSLLDHTSLGNNVGSTDLESLMEDGRRLRLSEETSWKWQTDAGTLENVEKV